MQTEFKIIETNDFSRLVNPVNKLSYYTFISVIGNLYC